MCESPGGARAGGASDVVVSDRAEGGPEEVERGACLGPDSPVDVESGEVDLGVAEVGLDLLPLVEDGAVGV